MMRLFAWAGAGIGAVALGSSWIGLGIFVLALGSFAGTWIGGHAWLLGVYIVLGMFASYGIPLSWALSEGRDGKGPMRVINGAGALLVGLIVTSGVFAVPSSFAASAGCNAGHSSAYRAMQVIPIWGIGQQLLAPANDPTRSCAGFVDS